MLGTREQKGFNTQNGKLYQLWKEENSDVSNATVWESSQFEKINFTSTANPSTGGVCVDNRQLSLAGILGRLKSEFLQRPTPSQTRLLSVCYDLWQHRVLRSWGVCVCVCAPGIMNLVLGIDLLYAFIHSFFHSLIYLLDLGRFCVNLVCSIHSSGSW